MVKQCSGNERKESPRERVHRGEFGKLNSFLLSVSIHLCNGKSTKNRILLCFKEYIKERVDIGGIWWSIVLR